MTRAEDRVYMTQGYPVRFCRICGGRLSQSDSHNLRWCYGKEDQNGCGAIYRGVFAGMGEEEKSILNRLADFEGQLADFEKQIVSLEERIKEIGDRTKHLFQFTM